MLLQNCCFPPGSAISCLSSASESIIQPGWSSPDNKLTPQVHSSSAAEFLITGWNSGKAWAFIPSRYNSATKTLPTVILSEKPSGNSLQSRNSLVRFQTHSDRMHCGSRHAHETPWQQTRSGSNWCFRTAPTREGLCGCLQQNGNMMSNWLLL